LRRWNRGSGFILHQVGWLELLPSAVSDRKHLDHSPSFIHFVDNPVDGRLLAVKQVPQFSLRPSGLRSNGTAVGIGR